MNLNPTYEYITTDWDVGRALQHLSHIRRIGLDTETTALDPINDEGFRVRLLQIAPNSSQAFLFDLFKIGDRGRGLLKAYLENRSVVKIMHHAKFDTKGLRYDLGVGNMGQIVDTMLASILACCGSDDRVGLREVCLIYTEYILDKEQQNSNWGIGTLSEKQLRYSAIDACILHDLWATLQTVLLSQGQGRVAKLEFDAVDAIANAELAGVHLDVPQWNKVYDSVLTQWEVLKADLQEKFKLREENMTQACLFSGAPTEYININHSPSVMRVLNEMRIPVPINPRTQQPTLERVYLEQYAAEYPILVDFLEYKGLEKARTSYGPAWVEKISPWTQRIHADFHQVGARKSGRMSCSNPNLQQPPRDGDYRKAFTAQEEGHVIISADYSQMELRILAEFCGDPDFQRPFIEGGDPHKVTAGLIFGIPEDDVDPDQRQLAKQNNFADVYGASEQRFALIAKITVALALEIQTKSKLAFPIKTAYLEGMAQEAIRTLQSRTASGRLIQWPVPADKQERSAVGRNGRNTPIQGTNADILKLAIKLINDELEGQSEIKMIHFVHDEVLLEAPESVAQDCAYMVQRHMIRAAEEFIKTVPVKVDTHIGVQWSK